jgi:hypothetical protein
MTPEITISPADKITVDVIGEDVDQLIDVESAHDLVEIEINADIIYLGATPDADKPEIINFTDAAEVIIDLTDARKQKYGDIPDVSVWFLNDDGDYDEARVPKKISADKTFITIQNSGPATGFAKIGK